MRRTPWTTCKHCGKRLYATEREAVKALNQCHHTARKVRLAGLTVQRNERRIYQCPWTDMYHLTSTRELSR